MQQTIGTVLSAKAGGEQLHTVGAGDTVRDAVEALMEHKVGAVLVENEEGLIEGIFTERDLLRRVVHPRRDPDTTPISMAMTREVRFVSPGTTVEAALALMHVNRFRHLLVMDGPRVCGLVSIGDMTENLLRHGEGRFEAQIREVSKDQPVESGGGDES